MKKKYKNNRNNFSCMKLLRRCILLCVEVSLNEFGQIPNNNILYSILYT